MEELEIVLEKESEEEQIIGIEEENNQEQEINLENENTIYGSNKAADISYEDTYENGVSDVQEAIDVAFAEISDAKEPIKTLHNETVDLTTLPVGIYYLTGKDTKIKYKSKSTHNGVITSDTQKAVLIALGGYNIYGRGVIFAGPSTANYTYMYAYSSGTMYSYNLGQLVTTSSASTIINEWTFNKLPKLNANATAYNHPVSKSYVDNKVVADDLGWIDLSDYNDDVYEFMGTLTTAGRYKFVDSYDDFWWFVEVQTLGDYHLGQTYWCTDEGYNCQYHRTGWYNEDDDVYEWYDWDSYMTWDNARYSFADIQHDHFTRLDAPVIDIRQWLDTQKNPNDYREFIVIQNDNKHKYIVKLNYNSYTLNGKSNYMLYQEYYDMEEPGRLYKRTGIKSSPYSDATVSWQPWYLFEGVTGDNI